MTETERDEFEELLGKPRKEPEPIKLRKPRIPHPAKHLREDGRQLWREVWSKFELDAVESGRLLRVCELADTRRLLLNQVNDRQALAEGRRRSDLIDRLLVRLGVDDANEAQHDRTQAAQAMARERWKRQQGRESAARRQHFA
jgi:hypothetical protein